MDSISYGSFETMSLEELMTLDGGEEEYVNAVQLRLDAQLQLLSARPQVLNDYLTVAQYNGGEAGLGYEIENVLEFSRAPLHRSASDPLKSTLIFKCSEPLNIDYVRISTSAHVNFALRSGVIWLYAAEHGDPRSDESVHSELFSECTSAADFDAACEKVTQLRTNQAQFDKKPHDTNSVEDSTTTQSLAEEKRGDSSEHGDDDNTSQTDEAEDEDVDSKFPDCFYFETDPITFATTVALRNYSRIKDMEKYIRGIFAEIDINGDGELSMEELVPPLIKMGYSARFARQIIRDADDDGNGVIDADEFTAHMSKLNLSSDAASCQTTFVRMLVTSVHDTDRYKQEAEKLRRGEALVALKEKTKSFVEELVEAGHGDPDEVKTSDQDKTLTKSRKKSKRGRTKRRKSSKAGVPYFHCSYMCFCGHTVNPTPTVPDPDPLFYHEEVKPRHTRRPFVNIAPPKMAPMPAPGPQVLPTINVFDNDFMIHLNKSPCVILFAANADQMISNIARQSLAVLAKEFADEAYPRQEMHKSTPQEILDGAPPYRLPRFLPQELQFFEIGDTHSVAPIFAKLFQILAAPQVLVVYNSPFRNNVCFELAGSEASTFGESNVRYFLHSFCSGHSSPVDKTEAFPVDPPNGTLQRVPGQLFESVVLDRSRDVLVYFYSSISNAHLDIMEQVAELLGVMTTLRVVSMNLDDNDIPFALLEKAQADWSKAYSAMDAIGSNDGSDHQQQMPACTFVQRTGIALYNSGSKFQPSWKRGYVDIESVIHFVRSNCTVTFDFSVNSYFRL